MISIAAARPPFVEFKRIAKHDPQASLKAGHRVVKDIDMAYIMQPGSKDQHEKVAEDWLESIRNKGLMGAADAFPQEWIDGFFKKYEAFKAGQEPPLNGTSVKEWAYLSPAQAENFVTLRILTIEDVAGMTEEAMARLGMGGRELRDKAREWVKGQEVAGSLQQENEALKARLAALEAKFATGQPTSAQEFKEDTDELAELREKYATKFGKAPHHKKSADTLKAELEAA